MPTDEGARVVELCHPGMRAIGELTETQIWSTAWRLAIRPAYQRCTDYLDLRGRTTNVSEMDVEGEYPFKVLYWDGEGSLAGMHVGLQLTYGMLRRCQLDVSVVLDTCRHRYELPPEIRTLT
jgi:hypothetical protein